jgi:hypothetical protein
MTELIPCNECGRKVSSEAAVKLGGKMVCPHCAPTAERALPWWRRPVFIRPAIAVLVLVLLYLAGSCYKAHVERDVAKTLRDMEELQRRGSRP